MGTNWKKNTAIFLTCQIISLFGSSLVQYAITWHITLATQSGVYMTLSIVCGFLPTFLLSPFAGVWADRYDKKKLIIIADGSIAVTTLILAISIMLGGESLTLMFIALAIRALGAAVQMPCVSAVLPAIVPEEHLTRVNGINGSAQSLMGLGSPMISAVLLKVAPYYSIFFIDVLTAAASIAIMLAFFKLPKREKKDSAAVADYWGEMKLGISYILNTKYLKTMFLFMAIIYLMFAPGVFLTPLQVTRNFGQNEIYLMAIEMAFSVGMIFGGIFLATGFGLKNRIYTIGIATMAMGACTLLLGFALPLWMYLTLMGVFGLAMPLCGTPIMVLLQEQVDPDYMGRVFGVLTMISSGIMPLGMLIFGPLADIMPIEWMLIATGIAILLLALAFMRDEELLRVGIKRQNK